MICYYFFCRSKIRGKKSSLGLIYVLHFAVTSVIMGWGKMNVFQFLKFLRRDILTFCWHGCKCGHWFVFFISPTSLPC